MISLNVNQKTYEVDVSPDMPLLWVLRDVLNLTGTKYGCGVAQCGACTVHLNGEAVRSCVTKVTRAEGQKVLTMEGLSENNDHPLQKAWQEIDVPQCGYCHSGQLMSAAVLLRENPHPTDRDIDEGELPKVFMDAGFAHVRLDGLVEAHDERADVLVKLNVFGGRLDTASLADHILDFSFSELGNFCQPGRKVSSAARVSRTLGQRGRGQSLSEWN